MRTASTFRALIATPQWPVHEAHQIGFHGLSRRNALTIDTGDQAVNTRPVCWGYRRALLLQALENDVAIPHFAQRPGDVLGCAVERFVPALREGRSRDIHRRAQAARGHPYRVDALVG
jgi:hypothetical protein